MRTLAEVGFTILCICAALYLGWQGVQGFWNVFYMGTSHDHLTPILFALGGVVLVKVADTWAPSRGLVGY